MSCSGWASTAVLSVRCNPANKSHITKIHVTITLYVDLFFNKFRVFSLFSLVQHINVWTENSNLTLNHSATHLPAMAIAEICRTADLYTPEMKLPEGTCQRPLQRGGVWHGPFPHLALSRGKAPVAPGRQPQAGSPFMQHCCCPCEGAQREVDAPHSASIPTLLAAFFFFLEQTSLTKNRQLLCAYPQNASFRLNKMSPKYEK